jgi:4-hydroxy-4-methyl-2-oxoglutarate aldolase
MTANRLPPALLEQIGRLTTCVVASTIETFDVRLRNTGFSDSSVRCIFEDLPPIVGYAATARIRTSDPPMEGHSYYDRTDWWNHILTTPAPRIVVIEDTDTPEGLGAFVGEVHANILMALGCVGLVTNGGVRDLPGVRSSGFQMFAGNVSVSHAYSHVFDFGGTVEVGHLKVSPGDLIHADRHGALKIPAETAEKIPHVARAIQEKRNRIIELCGAPDFSVEKLRQAIRETKNPKP